MTERDTPVPGLVPVVERALDDESERVEVLGSIPADGVQTPDSPGWMAADSALTRLD